MITITLSEPEARALTQLMDLITRRGCDLNTAEAAIVISRRVADAINAIPPKQNGAAVIARETQ
jgi:hypothetical protein